MMIRTIKFQARKESLSQFAQLAGGTKAAVAKMDGLQHSFVGIDGNGRGCLVGVWESAEKAQASQAVSDAIWAGLAEHLEGPPEFIDYPTALPLR